VVWLAATAVALVPCVSSAQNLDPVELIRRVQRQDTAPGEEVQFVMQLVDGSGQVRERTGTIYERQTAPASVDEMRLIRYYSPADIKGSGVLTIEHSDRPNDQWLYLPAYHTTRRIAPANRGDRYMGSDFLYEDIMRERVEEYEYRAAGKDTIDAVPCVVLEAVPVDRQLARESAYSKKRIWVDPDRDVILRVDFFDRDQRLFKRLTVVGVEKSQQKYRWREARMENFVRRHSTVMKYHDRKFEPVPERYFTEQYLKRGQ
jgi:hypothetical protein